MRTKSKSLQIIAIWMHNQLHNWLARPGICEILPRSPKHDLFADPSKAHFQLRCVINEFCESSTSVAYRIIQLCDRRIKESQNLWDLMKPIPQGLREGMYKDHDKLFEKVGMDAQCHSIIAGSRSREQVALNLRAEELEKNLLTSMPKLCCTLRTL